MVRHVLALPFLAVVCAMAVGCGSTVETSLNPAGPDAGRCQPTLRAQTTSFGSAGGTGSVNVTVARECTWTAAANASWIILTGGQQGQGDGTVTYRVNENADPVSRRANLTVGDQSVQLGQEAAPCRFSVSAGDTTVPATGGELSVGVSTHNACNWTASTSASWASALPTSGNGDATIRVAIAANTGQARSADVTIAGQRLTVSQEARSAGPPPPAPPPPAPPAPGPPAPPPPASCQFELSPSSRSFEPGGGSGSVRVRTTAVCAWTATSSASWVSIANPAGTGEAEVRYTVAENFTTSSRSATITIANETHRITQDRAREVVIDGRISGLSGSCPDLRFTVDGQVVTTDRETDFRSGNCSSARNGRDVEVRGFRQSNGTIRAHRVEFDD